MKLMIPVRAALIAAMSAVGASRTDAAQTDRPATPDAAVIRVDSTTTVRVCADCSPRTVTFAVTPLFDRILKIDPATEIPIVTEVLAAGVRDAAVEPRFAARWQVDRNRQPRALIVTVQPELRTQGAYTVVFNAFPTCRPRAPRVTVQIILPAAKLTVPVKIAIERTVWVPWLYDLVQPTSFTLRESGRVSGIASLQAEPPELMMGSDKVSGLVKVKEVVPAPTHGRPPGETAADILPADSPWLATLELAGDFPLGVSSGQLRLHAPELTEAVAIPIEVRSGLSLFYLIAAVVLGVVMSYWLKVLTKSIIELNTSRAAAAMLLRRVAADRTKYPDQSFRDAIDQEFTDLETRRRSRLPAEIDQARTALDTTWREALKDLVRRRSDVVQFAASLRELTSRAWSHPPALRQAVADTRPKIDDAVGVQETGDVTGANRELTAARDTLNAAAVVSSQWQEDARDVLDLLIEGLETRFATIAAALSANVAAWQARSAVLRPTDAPTPTKLEEHLQRIDTDHREVTASIGEVIGRLRRAAARAEAEQKPARKPAWRDVRAQIDRLEQLLAGAADDPATAKATVSSELDTLSRLWVTAAAKPKLSSGATGSTQDEDPGEILGDDEDDEAAGDASAGTIFDPFRLWLTGPGRGDRGGFILLGSSGDPYTAEIEAAESGIFTARFQQSVIVGLLFIVWALVAYRPAFDGTLGSLATVFFSALSVDVAVDSLLTKMKK